MTEQELLDRLSEATEGLTFMSESDYPFEVFRWETTEPTEAFVRERSGEGPEAPVETRTAAEFFRVAASEAEWKNAEQLAAARRFQALLRLLEENLAGLKVFRVGSVNIPVFIAGRAASGNWLGVSTRAVET